jgi:hypothetical protein
VSILGSAVSGWSDASGIGMNFLRRICILKKSIRKSGSEPRFGRVGFRFKQLPFWRELGGRFLDSQLCNLEAWFVLEEKQNKFSYSCWCPQPCSETVWPISNVARLGI